MKFKDLADGSVFQFIPQPGTRETAIKAGNVAYLLRSGERVDVHGMKSCEAVPPLLGTGYRLGVDVSNRLVLFSQANDMQVFVVDFLVIGHSMKDKREIRPIISKREREEFDRLVDIILAKLDANHDKAGHLLQVLKDTLFESQDDIITTESEGGS